MVIIYIRQPLLLLSLGGVETSGVRQHTVEMTKLLIILVCCTYSLASHHASHIIPVENYETELQDLGQHTEKHETPVKVIKITKTIAVKIPVPYPVKVIEKVPYPVHVNKPYPVHVPHVVHLPKERTIELRSHQDNSGGQGHQGDTYQVQEQGNNYQVRDQGQSGPDHFAPVSDDGHVQEGGYYSDKPHFAAGSGYTAPGSGYSGLGSGYSAPSTDYEGPAGGHHYSASDDGSYDISKYNPVNSYY